MKNSEMSINNMHDHLLNSHIPVNHNIYDALKRSGYLMLRGESENLPSGMALRNGYLKVAEKRFTTCDGKVTKYKYAAVTPEGLEHFKTKFANGELGA